MTAVSDAASVRLLIADYVAADSTGKINMVGGGVTVLGLQVPARPAGRAQGQVMPTASFGIVATVSVSPALEGRRSKIELSLRRADGSIVEIPAADADEPSRAKTEPLAVLHDSRFESAKFAPNFKVPPHTMQSKVQWILQFPTGLPLSPGRYFWQIHIDDVSKPEWAEEFYVTEAGARPTS